MQCRLFLRLLVSPSLNSLYKSLSAGICNLFILVSNVSCRPFVRRCMTNLDKEQRACQGSNSVLLTINFQESEVLGFDFYTMLWFSETISQDIRAPRCMRVAAIR